MQIDKQDLLSFYISADPSLKSKAKRAISDWVVKFLYQQDSMTYEDITNTFSRFMGIPFKMETQLKAALKLLKENNIIEPSANEYTYKLSDEYRKKVDIKKANVDALHEYVYLEYFKRVDINKEIVQNWFKDVTIGIFEKYFFDLYIDNFHAEKVHENYFQEIETIINEISSHITSDGETLSFLKTQYLNFLKDDDNKAAQLFLHYGMANFSAILFSSNNYINRISLDIFENTAMLLDTNVLFVIRIEGDNYTQTFPLIESVFKQNSVKLEYLQETAGEYDRSIKHNHMCMRNIVKGGTQRTILQPMAERNVFLRAIINKGYNSVDDVDKMFEEIKTLPPVFYHEVPIVINNTIKNDDTEYLAEIERMSNAILLFQQKLGTTPKTGSRLVHDAALLSAVNILRKRGEKYVILTNDYVLQEFAKSEVRNNNIPIALSFSVVLTMLEYFQSDPTNHASNVAPIFKRMLTSEMLSMPEDINPQDIARIYDYDHDIKMLDDQSFNDLIRRVKEQQINNVSDADIADMISTYIDSKIQRKHDDDFKNRQRIRLLERQVAGYEEQKKTDKRVIRKIIRDNVIREREEERKGTIMKMLVIIVCSVVCWFIGKMFPNIPSIVELILKIVSAGGGVGLLWRFIDFKHLSKQWVYDKVAVFNEVEVRLTEYNEDI